MDSTEQSTDVLVVGAGMAGLIAASELLLAGRSVTVVDKGRGVGGRLASRRIEGATFDHGAQGFTTGDSRCSPVGLQKRLGGAVAHWIPDPAMRTEGLVHWRGVPCMSGVAKHLALGIHVQLETGLVTLRTDAHRWVATTLNGRTIAAQAVILTPPVPQSLALLDASGVALPPVLRHRLNAIEYDRCLTVMARLEGPSRIPPPGGLTLTSGPLTSITDNQLKGISGESAVTLHATPEFSLEHWDRDHTESAHLLLAAAADWLGAGVRCFQVHGWRFSRPRVLDPEPCLLASTLPPLALAGDGFGGFGVEGAAFSGMTAATAILGCTAAAPRAV
jgi:predicted NAD/FAD-dependent oxidoreductase